MAGFEFDFGDLTEQLEKLDNFDGIAESILEKATPILEEKVKAECERHVRTRSMKNSVKKTKAKKGKNGWFAVVRPTGVDENGVRNMEKLAHIEYGTSKQSADPILSVAVKKSEQPIANIMQEIYNKEVGNDN